MRNMHRRGTHVFGPPPGFSREVNDQMPVQRCHLRGFLVDGQAPLVRAQTPVEVAPVVTPALSLPISSSDGEGDSFARGGRPGAPHGLVQNPLTNKPASSLSVTPRRDIKIGIKRYNERRLHSSWAIRPRSNRELPGSD